ncbi:MAG: RICIN domain-containing protein [Oligoflexus sp.]|nr:RICIN domain-containing protein [Oligoflexus sp.]
MRTYTGKTYQQFYFKPDINGAFVIVSRSGNFAVDVVGAAVANEAKLQIWPPNNSANERWSLTPP